MEVEQAQHPLRGMQENMNVQEVSSKLKKLFSGLGDQTYQLLREFQRFSDVIKGSPSLSKELTNEREALLGQLLAYLGTTRDDFDSRQKGQTTEGNRS
jgi:hypothetical protein